MLLAFCKVLRRGGSISRSTSRGGGTASSGLGSVVERGTGGGGNSRVNDDEEAEAKGQDGS